MGTPISEEQQSAVAQIAADHPDIRGLILFGSRARCDHRPDSDWDVVAVGLAPRGERRDELQSRLKSVLDEGCVELVGVDTDELQGGIHADSIWNAVADDGMHLAGDVTILERARSAARLDAVACPRAICGWPWLEAALFSCGYEITATAVEEWAANGQELDAEEHMRLGSFYSCAFSEPLAHSVACAYGVNGGGPWSVPIAWHRVADEWQRRQDGVLKPSQKIVLDRVRALDGPRRKTYGRDDPRRCETADRWMLRTTAGIEALSVSSRPSPASQARNHLSTESGTGAPSNGTASRSRRQSSSRSDARGWTGGTGG